MIWFLRHGEAEDSDPDWDRQLTEKGRRQARDAGLALAALGVSLELCLSSPRVRARETAELACEPLGVEVTNEDRLSGGAFDPLELTGGVEHVLLVGHEPDLSFAVAGLTGARVELKKGGIAGVEGHMLRVLMRAKETRAIATVNDS